MLDFQNEVINVVHIGKSSLYRMVIKYANPLRDLVTTSIIITPESVVDTQQMWVSQIHFSINLLLVGNNVMLYNVVIA